jgi:hypothetical protein
MEKGTLLVLDVIADYGPYIRADDDIFYSILRDEFLMLSCIGNSGIL